MSQKLLAKLTPYLFMIAVTILCFVLYLDTNNTNYLIPATVVQAKFYIGLFVYDKTYPPSATPPSCWTKCQYMFFRLI
jgi:hypothetical protein